MTYQYDVFVSYRRQPHNDAWMMEHLLPRLTSMVANELVALGGADEVTLFVDQANVDQQLRVGDVRASGIEPGAPWRDALRSGIKQSRCMLGLWSPTYFRSEWCKVEWQSFAARSGPSPIVVPVSVFNQDLLPPEAKTYNVFKLDGYVIDGPSLPASRLFPDFLQALRLLAGPVARAIHNAPPFADFPIVESQTPPPAPAPVAVGRF